MLSVGWKAESIIFIFSMLTVLVTITEKVYMNTHSRLGAVEIFLFVCAGIATSGGILTGTFTVVRIKKLL
jgi:hypothetical protein